MIGIIGAMEIETDGLISIMTDSFVKSVGSYNFVKGKICGKEAVVCRCGIGKVFSSTAAVLMIALFEPETIINLGVAGGAKPLKQGDIVVSEHTVQHDYDATADGLEKGRVHGFESPFFDCDRAAVGQLCEVLERLGYKYKVGTIASGDCFVSDRNKAADISRVFGAIAYDMESAAINQVCAFQGTGFVSVRAISDNGDDGAVKSFYEFVSEASAKAIEVIKEYIASFG